MIGTTAALIGMGISAAAGVGSAALGSKAAGKAANAQVEASKYAADLQAKSSADALAFQKETWAKQQADMAPFMKVGTDSVSTLGDLVKPGGELSKGWDKEFVAPTAATEQNDPGYAFRMQEGQKALERSAAARGTVLGGAALKAATRYGQDYSSNEYEKVYGRAKGEYDTAFNVFQTNQANRFNRLAALAGVGQTAAAQLGQEGTAAAQGVSSNLITTGANLGNLATQAGNARASGYVGSANAWGNAIGGINSSVTDALSLYKLLNPAAKKPGSGGGMFDASGTYIGE